MDHIVSVRFFQISRPNEAHTPLADLLQRIGNVDDPMKREKQLAPNVDVRLEVFDRDGRDAVVGEMTRIQSTNLPSQIQQGQRKSLGNVDRLGHSIVFRFNKRTSVLGFQYDRRVLPPYRFFQYVHMCEAGVKYESTPILRHDMWDRFQDKRPRVLEIGVADPVSLASVQSGGDAVLDAMKSVSRAYDAPAITIRLGMGHRQGELKDAVYTTARKIMGLRQDGHIELTKLRAKSSDEEGGDDINLLEEMLEYKEELELHNKDPDVNYDVKLAYIKRCMANV